MAILQAVKGLHPGQQFPLDSDLSILGRHPECDIVLDVGAVSRQHAQILRVGSEYFVEDLKSRNGTFVNGNLVEGRHKLADEDELKICDLVFTFHDVPAPPPQAVQGWLRGVPAMLVDEGDQLGGSTIMSKLDLSGGMAGLRVAVNPEVKLRALIEITRNLATALAVDDVLPKILDSLFKVFAQADRGFIVLQAPGGPLVPKAVKYRRAGNEDAIRISRTIVNEAMNSKQAVLSADAASDSRFGMSESIADFRIRSMMCAPLIDSEGTARGVIQIDTHDQRSRFQQDDLDVLASVATQASFAIENADLHERTLKQQAFERDLTLAHKVQQGFLPEAPPKAPGYQFFDFYEAAYQVGGDYYDYVHLPDDRLAALLADVSGKGISAALLMAKISAEARYCLASERNPAMAIRRLNASFSSSMWEDRFVTLVLLTLDLKRNSVSIVNAGHMAPLWRRADGRIEPVGEEESGVPLGIDTSYEYKAFELELAPGESLTAYTDGISEARSTSGELYGIEQIVEQLRRPAAGVSDLGRQLLESVKKFVGTHPQSDDMCLLSMGRE